MDCQHVLLAWELKLLVVVSTGKFQCCIYLQFYNQGLKPCSQENMFNILFFSETNDIVTEDMQFSVD